MSGPRSPGARRAGGRPRPGSGRTTADQARLSAHEVLSAVREQDAYVNLLLPARLRAHKLGTRDAAFTTELVSGTLRRRGTYDAVIAACVDRPLERVDPGVLDALRLGAHQLLSMRVPTHAAVGTTVDLVRARVGPAPAGFVNAVLRRVAGHDLAGWIRRVAPDPVADPTGFAVVATSHPRWVVEAFAEALAAAPSTGGSSRELDDLLAADNATPRVTLVARPGLCDVDELEAAGARPTGVSPYAAVLGSGDPGGLPAVAEGRAGVQDEGSQLVALALAAAPSVGTDARWLDLCAGPGGKAALLAALAGPRDARVLACELQPHRARLVAEATTRISRGMLGVVTADGTAGPWRPASFDRVLLDAPCSGLGALRRRPEARWRRTPGDVMALVPQQVRLLQAALDALRPGGVVGYATCTPVLAETAGVVTEVLARNREVRLEDAGPLFATTDHAGPLPGTVQLWPHRHGTDAMFFALLRKA